MKIRRNANPRKQGDAGLGAAICWFSCNDYTVLIPLTDSQPYDLAVDNGQGLKKVSVKTTTRKDGYGHFVVGLRTQGGNKSQFKIRYFDPTTCDLVFIVTSDGDSYLIPSSEVNTKTNLVLGKLRDKYRLSINGVSG